MEDYIKKYLMKMNEVKAIEEITKDILAGLYGSVQKQVQKHRNILMLIYKLKRYITVI